MLLFLPRASKANAFSCSLVLSFFRGVCCRLDLKGRDLFQHFWTVLIACLGHVTRMYLALKGPCHLYIIQGPPPPSAEGGYERENCEIEVVGQA